MLLLPPADDALSLLLLLLAAERVLMQEFEASKVAGLDVNMVSTRWFPRLLGVAVRECLPSNNLL
jgi:hypothetical protein